jgi:hypothetical protein
MISVRQVTSVNFARRLDRSRDVCPGCATIQAVAYVEDPARGAEEDDDGDDIAQWARFTPQAQDFYVEAMLNTMANIQLTSPDLRTSRSLRRYEQCISRSMITTRQLSEGLIAWIKLNPIGIDILPVFAIVGAYLEHLCPDIINEQADQRDEAEAACQK